MLTIMMFSFKLFMIKRAVSRRSEDEIFKAYTANYQ